MFLIDGLLLSLVFCVMKLFPNFTFYEVMQKSFGKIVTKIFLFALGILFTLKLAMLMRECFEFYAETSYVDFSWLVYLVPLILVLCYVSTCQMRVLGRGIEIFFYFIILALVMAILFSVSSIDVFAIFPLIPNGFSPVVKGLTDYCFWFGDFLIVLMLMGNIDYKQNTLKHIFVSYCMAMMVVLIVVLIHFSLFGSVSSSYKTSIVDITEYIPRITTSGRFTWIVLLLYPIAVIFAMMVFAKFACICFAKCFNLKRKNNRMLSYATVAVSVGILIATKFSQNLLVEFVTNYLKYGVLCVQITIPLLLPVALLIINRKENKHESNFQKNLEK